MHRAVADLEPFVYRAHYLTSAQADQLFTRLRTEVTWRQQRLRLFGRRVQQPRLTAWFSDPGIAYQYRGLRLAANAGHAALKPLRRRLEADLGVAFNSVLLNAYRDGADAMGWHADDEPELGPHPVIASISLGATRRMLIRPAAGGRSQRMQLAHGSLLLMQGTSQAQWRHCVPRTRQQVGPRINLTFRHIRA